MTPTPADVLSVGRRPVGWQPVETAPWGRRDILVRYGGGHDVWHARHGRPVMADVTHWSELPADPGAPSEPDAMAVALDLAQERDEWPIELRRRIAELLPRLRIAGPWLVTHPPRLGEGLHPEYKRAATVGDVALVTTTGEGTRWTPVIGDPGHPGLLSRTATSELAREAADARLRELGWVLCDGGEG